VRLQSASAYDATVCNITATRIYTVCAQDAEWKAALTLLVGYKERHSDSKNLAPTIIRPSSLGDGLGDPA